MNIEALLTYQKADLAFKKMNDELKKNENYRKMRASKKLFEAAKTAVEDSEKQAASVVSSYEQALAFIDEYADEIDALCEELEKDDLQEERENELVARLEKLQAEVGEWVRRAEDLKALAEQAVKDRRDAQTAGAKSRDDFNAAKKLYDEFKASKEAELEELRKKRDELKPAVEAELLEKYEKLTGEGVYPAFVAALSSDKVFTCGVCGMAVSSSAKTDLEKDGICVCESCRRIIYKL